MPQRTIIIKIGGSILTDKTADHPVVNTSTLENLASQIAQLYSHCKIVLVHGAGSFGHPLAKKYQIGQKNQTKNQNLGASEISYSMLLLNSMILKSLLDKQLPVVSLPPHALSLQKDKQIYNFDTEIIKNYLELNMIPLLFGDVVIDLTQDFSILSGDIIVAWLARNLNAQEIIFLSDVQGIFTANPKRNPQAKLIPLINRDNVNKVLNQLRTEESSDATGEMFGKLQAIVKHLKGKKVRIINGQNPNRLLEVIQLGQGGTLIDLKDR